FHTLVPDYSYPINKFAIRNDPDNSQNWFRHQLAELGILGSFGWIAWTIAMIRLLWLPVRASPDALQEAVARGALVALSVVSLIAMPTQNTVMTLAFWTIAFWWLGLGAPDVLRSDGESVPPPRTAVWWVLAVLAVGFAGLTLRQALGPLRPATRAAKFDWH